MKVVLLTTDNREQCKDYTCSAPYFGTAPQALLNGFALLPQDVEVHVISCARASMTSPAKLAGNIWFHSLVVPKSGWMTTGYQGCIRAVRSKIREIQPDIVHGQGTERDCAIEAVFSGRPNVLTIHGNMRTVARVNRAKLFSYMGLNALLEGMTLPFTSGVVCITSYTEAAVKDSVQRTWLVPNAVDSSFFEIEPLGLSAECPRLLVVANICHHKNQNALIRALDPVAAEFKFELVFLGNANAANSYGAEFLALVEERSWCKWGGFADRDGLRSSLSGAGASLLPSLEDNCPMAVLEALAAGVPVLAANIGGVPDLITDGVNGVLFDPSDADSMSTAVKNFLLNRAEARKMAEHGRRVALERYHPECIARRHLEIYREVLSNSR